MTKIRTAISAVAVTAAALLTSCSVDGTPIPAPDKSPDVARGATTNSVIDTLRPGTRIALGEGDDKVLCTLGLFVTDNVSIIGTTASYCVEKDNTPVYAEDKDGNLVLIGHAKAPYDGGGYSRQGNNVALIAIERGILKEKHNIETLGAISPNLKFNTVGAPSDLNVWFESAQKVMSDGEKVEVCWWYNNNIEEVTFACGVPKMVSGAKISVTPNESAPDDPPFTPSVAGAPVTWRAGKDATIYPLGTLTDYFDGVALIDSSLVQTSVELDNGTKLRFFG